MAIAGLLSGGARLLAGASKSSGAVRTGAGLASNMMKRKQVNRGDIVKYGSNKTQENISGKRGALVKSNVSLAPSPVNISTNISSATSTASKSKGNPIEEVKVKVIEIDKLLKGSFVAEKERIKEKKKQEEKQSRKGEEEELEEKTDDGTGKEKKSKDKLPKIGFFDRIKKFITATILAFILPKLIDYLPQLVQFLTVIAKIGDFIIDIGGKILNGLITLVDWGYQVYDSAKGFIGDKLGETAEKNFEQLMGNVNTMLNLALIAAMAGMGESPFRRRRPRRPRGPRGPRKFDPRQVTQRARNIRRIRNQRRMQQVAQRLTPFIDPVRDATQRIAQSRPVQNIAQRGRGLFDRIANNRFVKGATDITRNVAGTIYKGAVGTTNFINGLGKKFGTSVKNAYDGMADFAKKKYDDVIKAKDFLAKKFKQGTQALGNAVKGLADKAKEAFVRKILEPLQPIIKPLTEKVRSLGEKFGDVLKKIPGFDKVDGVLKKLGASGGEGLMKKLGAKAIPILGGIVNLLFAYDRIAQGDTFGGLLEGISGAFDLAGLVPGLQWAPTVSMAIDAYMLARDFIPQIQEGEEKVINTVGLGGIKSQLDTLAKKLPDLSEIVGMITGGKKEQTTTTTPTTGGTSTPSTSTSTPSTSGGSSPTTVAAPNTEGLPDRPKTIYLHWTAGGYNSVVGPYHTVFTGDGTKHRLVNYDSRSGHTYGRNSNSVGLSLASMGGGSNESNMNQAPTDAQLDAMSAEAASLATNWGWTKNDINLKNVMTHGEAGSNLDGKNMHDNYGPSIWGGTGERWDLDKLRKGQAIGQGGPEMRERIKAKMFTGGLVKGTQGRDRVPTLLTHGEFVIDADSTKAIESTFPGFLSAINKADGKLAIDVLRNYAEYEMSEVVTVPIEVPVPVPVGGRSGTTAGINIMPSSSSSTDDSTDILYMR